MPVCSHCHRRKAKRRCPALGSEICPLCCGLLRERKVHCPPTCPHLARHRPYQEKKIIKKKAALAEDVRVDERLNWLIVNIEAALLRIAQVRPEFTDRDAVLALEHAREKTERARTTLLVTEEAGRPSNEPGEVVSQTVEETRFEGKIILPLPLQVYKKEEKLKCLEQVILTVKRLAADDLEGRNYLAELGRRFARSQGAAPGGRIVSPR
jgi:hypothetical protein